MTPRKRRDRLNSIREIAAQLQQSDDLAAPDLTQSILARVDASRPFLDRRTRRMLWVGRGALVASVAAVVLMSALMQRFAPESVEIVARPAPLSTVVESVKTDATERLVVLREVVSGGPRLDAALNAEASSFDAMPSGGLLTLVTAASPVGAIDQRTEASSRVCVNGLCGPILPPVRAAQLVVPSSSGGATQAPPMALSAVKSSVALSVAFEPTRAPGRMRGEVTEPRSIVEARLAANATPSLGRRILLNELAPLGPSAAAGDCALAPK